MENNTTRCGSEMPTYESRAHVATMKIALVSGRRPPGSPNLARSAVCLVAIFACSCATVPLNPELKTRIEVARTVAVVAPDVEIIRYVSGGGHEDLPEEEATMASDLTAQVSTELSGHGFEVKTALSSKTTAAAIRSAYSQMAYAYNMSAMPATFDANYAQQAASIPSASPADYTFGFGPDCALIASQSGADALLLVRFQEFKRSAAHVGRELAADFVVGMLTMGLFVPQPAPARGALLAVTFVDGKTGDVLWGNQVAANGLLESPNSLVSAAFGTFPR